jgi:hypothetical protein
MLSRKTEPWSCVVSWDEVSVSLMSGHFTGPSNET